MEAEDGQLSTDLVIDSASVIDVAAKAVLFSRCWQCADVLMCLGCIQTLK